MVETFEEHELEAFNKFYRNIVEGDGERDLILHLGWKPYAFTVINEEIREKTELGRKLLDKIKDIRLI